MEGGQLTVDSVMDSLSTTKSAGADEHVDDQKLFHVSRSSNLFSLSLFITSMFVKSNKPADFTFNSHTFLITLILII